MLVIDIEILETNSEDPFKAENPIALKSNLNLTSFNKLLFFLEDLYY